MVSASNRETVLLVVYMPCLFVLGIKIDRGDRQRPLESDNAEKTVPHLCRPPAAGIKCPDI